MTAPAAIQIRPAMATEEAKVREIWDLCGLGRAAPDEWTALAEGDTSVVLVADDEGTIAGTAIASFDGWRAYIYHVAVAPQWRRQGLSRALLEEAEHYLLSAGARHVFVSVHEQNTEGFTLVGSEGYVPSGELVFSKRLATRFS
ncbi:MAG: GNAT family N-acetyltransferase [Dehalococcoidia bacterium]|nr:GNAT family N-acetyltransferase [Dehalococcoidia bacterium]